MYEIHGHDFEDRRQKRCQTMSYQYIRNRRYF